jgi:hypothetical protein
VAQIPSSHDPVSNQAGFPTFSQSLSPQAPVEQSLGCLLCSANYRFIDPSTLYDCVPVKNSSDGQFAWDTYSRPPASTNSHHLSNQRRYDSPFNASGLRDAVPSHTDSPSPRGSNESHSFSLVTSMVHHPPSMLPGGFTEPVPSLATSFCNPYNTASAQAPSSEYMSPSHFNQSPRASEPPGMTYSASQNGMYSIKQACLEDMGPTLLQYWGHLPQDASSDAFAVPPSGSQAYYTTPGSHTLSYRPAASNRPIVPKPMLAPAASLSSNEYHPYISEDELELRN